MLFFSSRIQDKFEDNGKYINIKRIIYRYHWSIIVLIVYSSC